MKSDYYDNFSQRIKEVFSALDLAEMLDQRRAFIGGEWREANSGWELKLEISKQAFSHQGRHGRYVVIIINHDHSEKH